MLTALKALFTPSDRNGPVDPVLAALITGLLGFGVVMVYSASAFKATVVFRDSQYFLKRQAIYAGVSMVIIFVVSRIDYRRLRPLTYPVLFGCLGLMVLSVIGLGHTGGGATRWLRLGPIHIQPSEAAKLGLILWLAYSLAKKQAKVRKFQYGMVPHLLVAGLFMLLCLKQPDFGGAVVLLFITFSLLFVAGARVYWLILAASIGTMAGVALIRFKAYRWERILAWRDMIEHRHDLAYQPFQSVMSFGSGETTGLGLGQGFQVLYLPEAHTDFISAIVGEELGFLGILGLCLVYLVIVARGVRVSLQADDEYGSYVAFGISVLVGVQALWNMAVAMAILPTKGLTLPFVSYGGSSLLVNAAAAGVLLNISRHATGPAVNRRNQEAAPADAPEATATLVTEAGYASKGDDEEPIAA